MRTLRRQKNNNENLDYISQLVLALKWLYVWSVFHCTDCKLQNLFQLQFVTINVHYEAISSGQFWTIITLLVLPRLMAHVFVLGL